MGCDGGTKALERKYSRWSTKKEKAHYTPEEIQAAKWTYCALSGEELSEPIVACELGYLYNKEAIINALIDKSLPEEFSHIRKLKDVFPVHFTYAPIKKSKGIEDSNNYWRASVNNKGIICPITKEEVGNHSKFCIIKSCGCVMSQHAIKEITSEKCLNCGKPFNEDDVIILNGSDSERKELRDKMIKRRELKNNKRKHDIKESNKEKDTYESKKQKKENNENEKKEESTGKTE
ncbi:hypothetical protein WA158_006999 [Blastocystis sp. Blastoise]